MVAVVQIEQARAAELGGDDPLEFLSEHGDWKVCLEAVFAAARRGDIPRGLELADQAAEAHPATGRIFAARVFLKHVADPASALAEFAEAVQVVPKSGEVWCEGARLFLSPALPHFDLRRARECLAFAAHLTPQYGDTFLELQRLEILERLADRCRACVALRGDCLDVLRLAEREVPLPEASGGGPGEDLLLLAGSADPNYGLLWNWCARNTLAETFAAMHACVVEDLQDRAIFRAYCASCLRTTSSSVAVCARCERSWALASWSCSSRRMIESAICEKRGETGEGTEGGRVASCCLSSATSSSSFL
jgi:hypothetical protein